MQQSRQQRSIRPPGEARVRQRIVAVIGALLTVSAVLPGHGTVGSRDGSSPAFGEEPITPLPREVLLDAGKVRLGEMLFHDVRLSRGDALACASCHVLTEGGDDNRARSEGADGELLDFNAPTLFNVALNFRLNWRGNFRTLEEQNEAVLLNPDLMNTTWEELLAKLRADEYYADAFARIYGSGPAPAHVLDALATFQRSLTTPDGRFDRRLRGERDASRQTRSAATSCSRIMAASPAIKASTSAAICFSGSASFATRSRRGRSAPPISAVSPSPTRRTTGSCSGFPVCATSP